MTVLFGKARLRLYGAIKNKKSTSPPARTRPGFDVKGRGGRCAPAREFGADPNAPAARFLHPPKEAAAGAIASIAVAAKRWLGLLVSLAAMAAAAACAGDPGEPARKGFVTVNGLEFAIDGEPYRFVGANMWYAAYLGSPAPYGDRERLKAELDLLKSKGVTNLRILGASERSPFRLSLEEAFRDETDKYNEDLLQGLDYALAEMGARGMKAVVYLNNFWEWSGGMGTYLYWTNGGVYVDLGDPEHPWPAFQNFTAQFYASEPANALYRDYIRAVVTRINTVNGVPYAEDPTIMSWQLANEPRPGFDLKEGDAGLREFYDWIDGAARYIKSLAPRQLVSSGNEGYMGCSEIESCFIDAHSTDAIDYLTFHIWPRNWSWFDPQNPEGTFDNAIEMTKAYIDRHLADAERLGKPITLEEFGLDRDGEALSPDSPTRFRDALLDTAFVAVEADARRNGPFAGTNLWAWGGYGRAEHEDYAWRRGDTNFTGDPPQEPQGRNSVFDGDASTLGVIKSHADRLNNIMAARADGKNPQ